MQCAKADNKAERARQQQQQQLQTVIEALTGNEWKPSRIWTLEPTRSESGKFEVN